MLNKCGSPKSRKMKQNRKESIMLRDLLIIVGELIENPNIELRSLAYIIVT